MPQIELFTPTPPPSPSARSLAERFDRALALHRAGELTRAQAAYEALLADAPEHAAALHMRGVLAAQRDDAPLAIALLQKAIAAAPRDAVAHANLGKTLCGQSRFTEALESLDRAIALNPGLPDAWSARGNVLNHLGRGAAALASCDKALDLSPSHGDAWCNRAAVLEDLGRHNEALACHAKAIALQPKRAEFIYHQSLCLLLLGRFGSGWRAYESRWPGSFLKAVWRRFAQPQWTGREPLPGKTILLHAEQGFGDTLQFCRYAPMVAARGARVLLQVQAPLRTLLADLPGVAQLPGPHDTPEGFDFHCPLASLPLAFSTTLDSIPADVPYLRSDAARVQAWRTRLGAKRGLRVGLVCSGNAAHGNDRNRSIALAEMLALAQEGVQLVSLQREFRAADAALLCAGTGIAQFADAIGDFADTAALVELMDVVVTVDTSVAHLAGAMGKPVWILLPANPDWRWMLDRPDSPWYPSARLFRRRRGGAWRDVIARVRGDLGKLIAPGAATTPPADAGLRQAFALHQAGRHDEARSLYDELLSAQPGHAAALHARGVLAAQAGDPGEAEKYLARAIAADPGQAMYHVNLGNALGELGRFGDAVARFDAALALGAGGPAAWAARARALNGLSRSADALESADRAIALDARHAPAWCYRAQALNVLERFGEALDSCDRALALDPEIADAWGNRGAALQGLQREAEALQAYDRALALKPNTFYAWTNRGVTLQSLGRHEDAIASYARALALRPADADTRFNDAMAHLVLGRFGEGWRRYESRWDCARFKPVLRRFAQPLWLGREPLDGKTVLLHAEQGYGDTLQFCRYAALVAARGARVLLLVPRTLAPLMQGVEGVAHVVTDGDTLPAFDFHCPLLSLPLALRTTRRTIPAPVPYLRADPARVRAWRERIEGHGPPGAPRVGLAWSGSAAHGNDRKRSIPLAEMAPLAGPGRRLVSLQKELRDSDAHALAAHPGVAYFGGEIRDFCDTAALVELMELVIAVDTSVAHLAGAMGKPVWLLLPFAPDWRWLLDREDSPWYPTARLFRKGPDERWDAVIDRVATALDAWAPAPRRRAREASAPRRS